MKKTLFILGLLFLTQVGFAEDSEKNIKQVSKNLISKAKAANDRAIKLKNEWRDARKLIKKAKKLHKNKKYKEAIKASKNALNQANMSIQQYNKQKRSFRFFE
ncbi:MAG: hypothetical protein VYE31_02040 [Pseudomonadota bacterium]|nr:hypothetical protein [Pseudomonadota bacterium]